MRVSTVHVSVHVHRAAARVQLWRRKELLHDLGVLKRCSRVATAEYGLCRATGRCLDYVFPA